VVLDDWPVANVGFSGFTTVASWRGAYGRVEHQGTTYGLKAHEFRKLVELPEQVELPFEIALDISDADAGDRQLLQRHGWRLVDPRAAAGTPESFRDYVRGSGAEFSVAQGIYVETCSGWFSDRTTRYLAAGRPALIQDTGFTRTIPAGEGLVPFSTLPQAVAGAKRIAADYAVHCAAARSVAEELFDSDRVLADLLCG
jgi:hypothetical protein